MTYLYGATLQGTSKYIRSEVQAEHSETVWPDKMLSFKFCQYAATKLFQGIAATVPASAHCMQWLKDVAKQQPKGKRMQWKAPTGFLVQHDYLGYREVRVRVHSCGLSLVLLREVTDDTCPVQMQNAIAPNFVHALDASHLTFTANAMAEAGLSMVAIHDSFGTHPCDVAAMHRIIREQFVRLYAHRNILGEFLWDVQAVGEPPNRGNLDILQVLDSEFFFS